MVESDADFQVRQRTREDLLAHRLSLQDVVNDASLCRLACNEVIVQAALRQRDGAAQLKWAPPEVKASKSFMLRAVKLQPLALEHASEALKSDEDVVLSAVKGNGQALEFASESLRSRKQFIVAAASTPHRCFGAILDFASDGMRSDKDVFTAAVRFHGARVLWYAAKACRSQRDFILSMMDVERLDPGGATSLRYAADRLRHDKPTVLEAVAKSRHALCDASPELQSDRDVLLALVQTHGAAALANYRHQSCTLVWSALSSNKRLLLDALVLSNKQFAIAALHRHARAHSWLTDDKEIVMAAMRKDPSLFRLASTRLKDDKDIVKTAVQHDPTMLKHASDRLRDDKDIVLAAVQKNSGLFKLASDRLKDDEEMVLSAVQQNPMLFKLVSNRLKDNEEMVLTALQLNPMLFKLASDRLRDNSDMVLAATEKLPKLFDLASNRLKDDLVTVLAAVQLHPDCIRFASKSMQSNRKVLLALAHQHASRALGPETSLIVLDSISFNEELIGQMCSLMPGALQNVYMFRVSLLSGRSCNIAIDASFAFRLHREVVDESFRLLSIDPAEVRGAVELVKGTELQDNAALRTLKRGELHDLQLLLA